MRVWRSAGLEFLSFPGLDALAGLDQAVTTRSGGVSGPPFDSLNLGGGEDQSQAVGQNLALVKKALGLESLCWVNQVHGADILPAPPRADGLLGQADGLATDQPGVGLMIKQADCQAVMLVEPKRRVLAILHVGWRGNVLDLPGRGVAWLTQRYGLEPAALRAAISPSLGPCCAEFVNHEQELGPNFLPYRLANDHFDLWAATRDQLTRAGVPARHIETAGLCTRCDQRFYSYRRDKTTGRFATVAVWR